MRLVLNRAWWLPLNRLNSQGLYPLIQLNSQGLYPLIQLNPQGLYPLIQLNSQGLYPLMQPILIHITTRRNWWWGLWSIRCVRTTSTDTGRNLATTALDGSSMTDSPSGTPFWTTTPPQRHLVSPVSTPEPRHLCMESSPIGGTHTNMAGG